MLVTTGFTAADIAAAPPDSDSPAPRLVPHQTYSFLLAAGGGYRFSVDDPACEAVTGTIVMAPNKVQFQVTTR
jgi:hypothetical protein